MANYGPAYGSLAENQAKVRKTTTFISSYIKHVEKVNLLFTNKNRKAIGYTNTIFFFFLSSYVNMYVHIIPELVGNIDSSCFILPRRANKHVRPATFS
jgi:hypothetical protein